MPKTAPTTKSETTPAQKLEKLFEERERSNLGSEEEKRAAEKILETIFPDTDVR